MSPTKPLTMSVVPDTGFTSGESKLLLSIIKHLEGDIATNWQAVAAECGYKDQSIARTRWGQIRKKKKKMGGAEGASAAGGKKGGFSPKMENGEGDAVAGDEGVGKKRKRAAKKVKIEHEVKDEDGAESD
ncbi:hypothetical protein K461DRAFT_318109 [Myriangium duriaei CBS 260.36]|uniref:Myb-like DNA-binding domain-containing protein n=1 Tax=Myriangium duriaei CBS 260.36 TaxID=1168546 RepID=A0A9P4JFY6_9PEZI|nr:hypothetical protein K461DRAFT_318109 [Myriangium duriaei CBS 260.36]